MTISKIKPRKDGKFSIRLQWANGVVRNKIVSADLLAVLKAQVERDNVEAAEWKAAQNLPPNDHARF